MRTDFTSRVTHLTCRTEGRSAFDNLIKIFEGKQLKRSITDSGFIVGDRPAVCFQDVPLFSIAEKLSMNRNS